MIKQCGYSQCGNTFEASRSTAKFCSKKCNLKHWIEQNPERYKEHQKNHRNKVIKLCKRCGVDIQRGGSGAQYCAPCAKQNHYDSTRRHKQNSRDAFHQFKTSCGCAVCGWNAFGAALDFHHIDDNTKEGGIVAGNWATDKAAAEYDKCILVCKNCHYGIHHRCVDLTQHMIDNKPNYKHLAQQYMHKAKQNGDVYGQN